MKESLRNSYEIIEEAHNVRVESEDAQKNGTLEQVEARIFSPFCNVDYDQKSADISGAEAGLSFSMEAANDYELAAVYNERYAKRQQGAVPEVESGTWFKVDRLAYKIADRQFDISGMLPPDYGILFYPDSKTTRGTVMVADKKIIIRGELASIGTLAVILHEVGHVHDIAKLEKLGVDKLTTGGLDFENDQAEKLRKEKEASLFALRKMWPALKNKPRQKSDILMWLKNYAYTSYCQEANEHLKIKYDTMDGFDDFADGLDDE